MTTFQFYENKIWNKARIHYSDCSFCNFGEGIHPNANSDTGRWSEQFNSLDEVISAAIATGRKVSVCKRCIDSIPLPHVASVATIKLARNHTSYNALEREFRIPTAAEAC